MCSNKTDAIDTIDVFVNSKILLISIFIVFKRYYLFIKRKQNEEMWIMHSTDKCNEIIEKQMDPAVVKMLQID